MQEGATIVKKYFRHGMTANCGTSYLLRSRRYTSILRSTTGNAHFRILRSDGVQCSPGIKPRVGVVARETDAGCDSRATDEDVRRCTIRSTW
jgi:hypothetical protein